MSDCNTAEQASSVTLHLTIKERRKHASTHAHTHTHAQWWTHSALIFSSWYKYSATVQPLWLPGSCQRLLARLSHQSSSFLLPIFRRVNGPHCAQSAVLPLTGCLSLCRHQRGKCTVTAFEQDVTCKMRNGVSPRSALEISVSEADCSGSRSTELYFCDVKAESNKSNLVLVIFKQWDGFMFHRKVFRMLLGIVISN